MFINFSSINSVLAQENRADKKSSSEKENAEKANFGRFVSSLRAGLKNGEVTTQALGEEGGGKDRPCHPRHPVKHAPGKPHKDCGPAGGDRGGKGMGCQPTGKETGKRFCATPSPPRDDCWKKTTFTSEALSEEGGGQCTSGSRSPAGKHDKHHDLVETALSMIADKKASRPYAMTPAEMVLSLLDDDDKDEDDEDKDDCLGITSMALGEEGGRLFW